MTWDDILASANSAGARERVVLWWAAGFRPEWAADRVGWWSDDYPLAAAYNVDRDEALRELDRNGPRVHPTREHLAILLSSDDGEIRLMGLRLAGQAG